MRLAVAPRKHFYQFKQQLGVKTAGFRPKPGRPSFWSARIIITGIETMHMIRKGQLGCPAGQPMSAAQQFYSLAI